jgi:hypothetical protein
VLAAGILPEPPPKACLAASSDFDAWKYDYELTILKTVKALEEVAPSPIRLTGKVLPDDACELCPYALRFPPALILLQGNSFEGTGEKLDRRVEVGLLDSEAHLLVERA